MVSKYGISMKATAKTVTNYKNAKKPYSLKLKNAT